MFPEFFDALVHPIDRHLAVCTFFILAASMKLLTFLLVFLCRTNHYIQLKAMDIGLFLLAVFLKRLLLFIYLAENCCQECRDYDVDLVQFCYNPFVEDYSACPSSAVDLHKLV